MKQLGVWYRFIEKRETTHTADAAKATGVELCRLTKNLVSETEKGEYVMLIIPGDKKVNLQAAAESLGASQVSLVPLGQAESISGYPPGGTPSIGHKTHMRVALDRSLLKHETIYCGGGSRDRLLELKVEDVLKVNRPVIAAIST